MFNMTKCNTLYVNGILPSIKIIQLQKKSSFTIKVNAASCYQSDYQKMVGYPFS